MAKTPQEFIEWKVDCRHGIKTGQRVFCAYRRQVGTVTGIIVCPGGPNADYGQCAVTWEDGTSTVEHPEHLSSSAIKQPAA